MFLSLAGSAIRSDLIWRMVPLSINSPTDTGTLTIIRSTPFDIIHMKDLNIRSVHTGRNIGLIALKIGQCFRYLIHHLRPIPRCPLPKETHGRIPGRVFPIEHPAPFRITLQQHPDGSPECTGQMGDLLSLGSIESGKRNERQGLRIKRPAPPSGQGARRISPLSVERVPR